MGSDANFETSVFITAAINERINTNTGVHKREIWVLESGSFLLNIHNLTISLAILKHCSKRYKWVRWEILNSNLYCEHLMNKSEKNPCGFFVITQWN